jgi:hypothetical protein
MVEKLSGQTVAEWGSSSWVTIVEIEFDHVMHEPGATDILGPRPDRMHPGLNKLVTAVTENGLLAWLHNGLVLHVDWTSERQCFIRRDGQGDLLLRDVRAWGALPTPIAKC